MFAFRSSFMGCVASRCRSMALPADNFGLLSTCPKYFRQVIAASSPLNISRLLSDILGKGTTCFMQKRFVQTKSDMEMSNYLLNEIQAEKGQLKNSLAGQVKGFEVETNNADLILKKKFGSEEIKITVNVNHSFSTEIYPVYLSGDRKTGEHPNYTRLICKPNFRVEIQNNGSMLALDCVVRSEQGQSAAEYGGAAYRDLFSIEKCSVYKGEFKDNFYVLSSKIMEHIFYDNLMNMLDDRGINSEFVQQITDFCTLYESKLYINLLEHLQDIVKSK